MKKQFLIILLILSTQAFAQVGINTDGTTPNASAMLDVKSENKGMLVPRLSTAQRNAISNAATGLVVFDNDQSSFYFYDGNKWQNLANGGAWEKSSTSMYLSDNTLNVGIGTNTPSGKLMVKADANHVSTAPIFEVKNKNGQTILGVYDGWVEIYGNDNPTAKTGEKGGLEVAGYDNTKGITHKYFTVSDDSVRFYIANGSLKTGEKGGLEVAGYDNTKATGRSYLSVTTDSTVISFDQSAAKTGEKGGLEVAAYDNTKAIGNIELLRTTPDSTSVQSLTGQNSFSLPRYEHQDVAFLENVPAGSMVFDNDSVSFALYSGETWIESDDETFSPIPNDVPTAATTAATSIFQNTATLNGIVDANNRSTTVTFEYGLTTAYGSTVTATQSPAIGDANTTVSADISSLTANTTYHYRVKAVNALGTTYGNDLTFNTFNPFITTWVTTDGTILIPTLGASGTYNYNLKWTNLTNTGVGNGSASGQTTDYNISGLENGSTYRVDISGTFPHFYMNNNLTHRTKLKTIEQWGDIVWTSMQNAFYGCLNMTYNATDNPNLTSVSSMEGMFRNCNAFVGNSSINNWNTSAVTNMQYMFAGATVFNQGINSWVVSAVTDFDGMFELAANFNQNLSSWNVSNATTMYGMFINATAFNQSLAGWDISSITEMTNMLNNCGMSTDNYDATLTGWATLSGTETVIPSNITLGAAGVNYCSATTARNTLDVTKAWTINDAGKLCISMTYSAPIDIVSNPPTLDGVTLNVSAQEGGPTGLAFNPTGTKMYVIGTTGDKVNQYTLSNPFNISSGVTHDGTPYSIADTDPLGINFNNDGTKMYVVAGGVDKIYEYYLTTPFETRSGVSYAGSPLSVGTEGISPREMNFNPSGTKMFVIDANSLEINQYNLTTPFQTTSGVTYQGNYVFSAASEGFIFSPDGKKLLTVSAAINQFSLATPFDITSGVTSDGSPYSVSAGQAIKFSTNGTKMFIIGWGSKIITQYSFTSNVFKESGANNGSVNGSLIVSLQNDTFTSEAQVASNLNISNLPSGLTPQVALSVNNTIATITLTGQATNHANTNDIANMIFTFGNGAFTSGNASKISNSMNANTGLGIDFN